jgi:hypothetical protein
MSSLCAHTRANTCAQYHYIKSPTALDHLLTTFQSPIHTIQPPSLQPITQTPDLSLSLARSLSLSPSLFPSPSLSTLTSRSPWASQEKSVRLDNKELEAEDDEEEGDADAACARLAAAASKSKLLLLTTLSTS